MEILSYIINTVISASLIYITIELIDRGNFKNNPVNAVITAVILNLAGKMSFIFFFLSLIIWVYLLINWYSMGFFKSFIAAFIYTVLNFIIGLLVAMLIFGPGAIRHNEVLKRIIPVIQKKYQKPYEAKKEEIQGYVQDKVEEFKKKKLRAKSKSGAMALAKVTLVLKNGRSIAGRIISETEDRYLVDIADGASEAVIRKDLVDHIEKEGRAADPEPGASGKKDEFTIKRREMIRAQIKERGITDETVLKAMLDVERHRFVPAELANKAYEDYPLPIEFGQTISQPYIVAYMTELAAQAPHEKVLEIGTGSGYQAAILAKIFKKVYTIEIVEGLASSAAEKLKELGYDNVEVKWADGYKGWPEEAPFDAIIVTAAPEEIPKGLAGQLKIGGRMIVPVGTLFQELYVIERTPEGFNEKKVLPVRFVPMVKGDEKNI